VTEEDITEHLLMKQREKEASKKSSGMGMAATDDKDTKKNETEKVKHPKPKKIVTEKKEVGIQIKPRNNLRVKKSAL
jgi:hypothetical protein